MRVHWTDTALGHLSDIHDHIAQHSPLYARATVERLTSRSKQIARFPRSGRAVPEFETEDIRQIVEGSYRIIYRILPQQLDVLAVVHGAQELRHLR